VGTGIGQVLFYDVRKNMFLINPEDSKDHFKLKASGGWIVNINLIV
jgi:hypothetical protein